ncbi:MAG: DUF2345 domain-containing protein, partial [Azospira sp.]
ADKTETGKERQDAEGKAKAKGTQWHLKQALAAWEKGSNTDPEHKGGAKEQPDEAGQQPILVASAVAGIGITTPQSATFATGQNFDQVSARDTNQSTARRWIHNVGQSISLFVQGVKDKTAIKLYAARGKVEMQAQSDSIEITGDDSLTIISSDDRIFANAKEHITFACGGAYIKIAGGNIDIHCPAIASFKAGNYKIEGPTSLAQAMNSWGQTKHDKEVVLRLHTGEAAINRKFRIEREDGSVLSGVSDGDGKTGLQKSDLVGQYSVTILD